MKKLIALFAIVVIGFTADAQFAGSQLGGGTYTYTSPADTLVANTNTGILSVPANSFGVMQSVSYTFAMDSVGGTPGCTLYLYTSNDNIHWTATGSTVTFTNKNYWKFSSTVTGKSDTTVTVNTNPWTANWFGFKVKATSATQRARWYMTINSHATY